MANFLMTLGASDIQAYLVRDVISKKYKFPDFSTRVP